MTMDLIFSVPCRPPGMIFTPDGIKKRESGDESRKKIIIRFGILVPCAHQQIKKEEIDNAWFDC
jgi:hypothetical protein